MISSRTSCATWTSWSSSRPLRSAGPSIWSRSFSTEVMGALARVSCGAGQDVIGYLPEARRFTLGFGQRRTRLAMRVPGELPRSLEAVDADIGCLSMALVGAARLSDLGFVARHVEDVVDDLENHPELGRKAPERDCGRSARAAARQDRADRRGDQRAGLELVEVAQLDGAVAGDVEVLAADHAADARGAHHLAHRGQYVGRVALLPGQGEPQRLGEQAVAGQDRHVLAERDVAGRLAAA